MAFKLLILQFHQDWLKKEGMQLQNWMLVGLLVFLYLEKGWFYQNPIIYEEKQLTQLSTTL